VITARFVTAIKRQSVLAEAVSMLSLSKAAGTVRSMMSHGAVQRNVRAVGRSG